jgi:hypothetical protein
VAVAVTLLVILGSSGIVYAGTRTLPGDALYPVKTTVEEARLWVAQGEHDVQLSLQFAEYRIQEIRRLSTIGRYGDVSTAASRFGAQIRCADQALVELAEVEPELAATLSQRARETRTQYRQELSGLLQTVPEEERSALDDILAFGDDLDPEHLLGDDDERQGPLPAHGDIDPREPDDELRPDDDRSPLAAEPAHDDEGDSASKDVLDDRDVTDHTPEHHEPHEDTASGPGREGSGDEDGDDEHSGDRVTAPAQPDQEHPVDDDSAHSTPEPGDGDGDSQDSDHDDGERDELGDEDDSQGEDDPDDGEGSQDEDDSGEQSGSGSDDGSDHDEHDGQGERDD